MRALFNKQDGALKRVLLLCLFFFISHSIFSQEVSIFLPNQDSILTDYINRRKVEVRDSTKLAEKMDTLRVYKKIKHFAEKRRFTKWLYELAFVDPEPKEYPETPVTINETKDEKKEVNPYINYENAVIRDIKIIVYDPFGHSVNDTFARRINIAERVGNVAHVKSRQWMINNRLLFHKNDTVNPLELSETERLLRGAVFVNDARVTIEPTSSPDSVDIRVVVLDKWSITIPVLITDVSGNAKFRNQNLMGLGQQFEQYIGFKKPDVFEYNGFYGIDNIDNTYISGRLAYAAATSGTNVGVSFDRGFFSPLTPWAGGLSLNTSWSYYYYTDPVDSTAQKVKTNVFSYDAWTGRAYKLSKEKSIFNLSTNIISGWRFYKNTYLNRPSPDFDPLHTLYNTSAFVGNIGFAVQEYYKDKYIHRFGANEDVPEGMIVQYIYGGIKKQYAELRYYSGIEIARAKHLKFGYVSATLSYGVFFNKYVANDITTHLNLYYFSNLRRTGHWYFRQFIYYNFVYGANKLFNETVTLSGSELYGFNPGTLTGNTKMVINSETVAYAPYKFIGFKFAPVLLAGFGMIGDPQHPIAQSNLYQGYSLGVMIRNENLVSSTFQFSFGYYPFLPDGQNSVWSYNPVTSFTLRVRGFAVSKPEFISYY
ncbi:MAG: hypothetical protein ACXVC7_08285 [Bacteroidia bacterium]